MGGNQRSGKVSFAIKVFFVKIREAGPLLAFHVKIFFC